MERVAALARSIAAAREREAAAAATEEEQESAGAARARRGGRVARPDAPTLLGQVLELVLSRPGRSALLSLSELHRLRCTDRSCWWTVEHVWGGGHGGGARAAGTSAGAAAAAAVAAAADAPHRWHLVAGLEVRPIGRRLLHALLVPLVLRGLVPLERAVDWSGEHQPGARPLCSAAGQWLTPDLRARLAALRATERLSASEEDALDGLVQARSRRRLCSVLSSGAIWAVALGVLRAGVFLRNSEPSEAAAAMLGLGELDSGATPGSAARGRAGVAPDDEARHECKSGLCWRGFRPGGERSRSLLEQWRIVAWLAEQLRGARRNRTVHRLLRMCVSEARRPRDVRRDHDRGRGRDVADLAADLALGRPVAAALPFLLTPDRLSVEQWRRQRTGQVHGSYLSGALVRLMVGSPAARGAIADGTAPLDRLLALHNVCGLGHVREVLSRTGVAALRRKPSPGEAPLTLDRLQAVPRHTLVRLLLRNPARLSLSAVAGMQAPVNDRTRMVQLALDATSTVGSASDVTATATATGALIGEQATTVVSAPAGASLETLLRLPGLEALEFALSRPGRAAIAADVVRIEDLIGGEEPVMAGGGGSGSGSSSNSDSKTMICNNASEGIAPDSRSESRGDVPFSGGFRLGAPFRKGASRVLGLWVQSSEGQALLAQGHASVPRVVRCVRSAEVLSVVLSPAGASALRAGAFRLEDLSEVTTAARALQVVHPHDVGTSALSAASEQAATGYGALRSPRRRLMSPPRAAAVGAEDEDADGLAGDDEEDDGASAVPQHAEEEEQELGAFESGYYAAAAAEHDEAAGRHDDGEGDDELDGKLQENALGEDAANDRCQRLLRESRSFGGRAAPARHVAAEEEPADPCCIAECSMEERSVEDVAEDGGGCGAGACGPRLRPRHADDFEYCEFGGAEPVAPYGAPSPLDANAALGDFHAEQVRKNAAVEQFLAGAREACDPRAARRLLQGAGWVVTTALRRLHEQAKRARDRSGELAAATPPLKRRLGDVAGGPSPEAEAGEEVEAGEDEAGEAAAGVAEVGEAVAAGACASPRASPQAPPSTSPQAPPAHRRESQVVRCTLATSTLSPADDVDQRRAAAEAAAARRSEERARRDREEGKVREAFPALGSEPTSAQLQTLLSFISLTGFKEEPALQMLRMTDWKLDEAVQTYLALQG
jgi:hypothetical protein